MAKDQRRKTVLKVPTTASLLVLALAGAAAWLYGRATVISDELQATAALAPQLKSAILSEDVVRTESLADELRQHTARAKKVADDPLWILATAAPVVGNNFSAVSEIAQSANDVANLGVSPLVEAFGSVDWDNLVPGNADVDLENIKKAAPKIASAATTFRESRNRLEAIPVDKLLPQVSGPVSRARDELAEVVAPLSVAAQTSSLAPAMLGIDGSRTYLLMIQNNAEARSTGGIPGALAVVTFDKGKMTLSGQSSAADLGAMAPVLPIDEEQKQIYTSRVGKYMQDVNLTPDFPTSAAMAKAMWEKKKEQRIDGVISIDPVVLSYLLSSTGPVAVTGPELAVVKASGLPTELTGTNVVSTLLSAVYAKIQQPKLQDTYFAAVAQEVFNALANGKGEAKGLIAGLTRGVEEGRVLVWSARSDEQSVIATYAVGGAITGPSISPAGFGVYFNDGTGAKMDYYVRRKVQLLKECPRDGYENVTVSITSTNTVSKDGVTSLPAYVTGGGVFGVPPGTVQTNIVAYGPAQANIESAAIDGKRTPFAPYLHGDRPVGVVAQQLAPGETKTVSFSFGKIVQHTEPDLSVTPTVQPVKDVIFPTQKASCDTER